MAQVLVERQVLFSGIWRPRSAVDDAFLRTVSQQFLEKAGAQSSWRLTREGLTIVAQRGEGGRQGQTDQIPVQAIKEVTVNRYNSLCLMTLYVDAARRFNALVCRCHTEQDATEIVQVFRRLRKSLSGEGYRIDLKQPQGINWTLKTKENGESEEGEKIMGDLSQTPDHLGEYGLGQRSVAYTHPHPNNNNKGEVAVEMEEENLEREPLEVEGRHCFNVGVQADLTADDDTMSMTSEMSYQSLKEELETLSNEVRDIKILLEQTTGISAEEFFRRRRYPNAPILVPVKRHLSQESDGGRAGNGEKSVNFAAEPGQEAGGDEDMEFDIRSVGMQTTDAAGSKRGKYLKRVRHALTPNRYQQSSYRSRSGSSTSSQPSPGPTSPVSPFSPTRPADNAVFFTSPHAYTYSESRRDPRFSSSSMSRATVYSSGGTVVRPIESVYQAHTPGFRQKRRQVIVLPNRSASMPRQFRKTPSDSAPAKAGPRHQAPKSAAGSVAENGAS